MLTADRSLQRWPSDWEGVLHREEENQAIREAAAIRNAFTGSDMVNHASMAWEGE
jgi:hypothetical protein